MSDFDRNADARDMQQLQAKLDAAQAEVERLREIIRQAAKACWEGGAK